MVWPFGNTTKSKSYNYEAGDTAVPHALGLGNVVSNMKVPINVDMPIDTRVNASKKSDSRQWNSQSTYNPIFAPQDARSMMIITNSPSASMKKADKTTGANVIPTFSQIPSMATDMGATEFPIDVKPKLDFGFGIPSGISSWVMIGAVGVGGFFIYKGLKQKKGAKK